MTRKRFLPFLLLLPLVISGCASSPADIETGEVWSDLLSELAAFEGARGFATVSLTEAGRSIEAGFRIGGNGNLELTVISPFGTSLATVFTGAGEVVIVNRSTKKYWEGDVDALQGLLPLGGIQMEGLGYLLAGLPPYRSGWSLEPAGNAVLRVKREDLRMLVLEDGIASVAIGSPPVAGARLALPSRPPRSITIVDGEGDVSAEITVERFVLDSVDVERPSTLGGFERVTTWMAVIAG